MVVIVCSATLTSSHAVVQLKVMTVETGSTLVEQGYHLLMKAGDSLKIAKLSILEYVIEATFTNLKVYTVVILRPVITAGKLST